MATPIIMRSLLATALALAVVQGAQAGQSCRDLFGRGKEIPVRAAPESSGVKASKDPLYSVRADQKAGTNGVLKGTESTPELLTAFSTLQEMYIGNRHVLLGDIPSQMLRFVDYDAYKSFKQENKQYLSPMQIYGVETMRAWKEADDFLTSIPIGKLELTPELFKQVAELSGRELKSLPIAIPRITADAGGYFKLLPNSGRAPLKEPLTEAQFEILKANKWLGGFIELPSRWSKPNARRGIILYALPHTVPGKIKKLIEWYNTNKDTMDPIRLATEFQRIFISIHPFVDGNGRSSRLLMDRILLEHGLPPSLVLEHNMDLYADIEDYTRAVRFGVADTLNLLKDEAYKFTSKDLGYGISDVNQNGNTPKKWIDHALVQKYNELTAKTFRVGDRLFKLHTDGFIYDQFGVPHEYNEGTFYPIADRMTELYDFGGDVEFHIKRGSTYEGNARGSYKIKTVLTTQLHRSFSPLKKEVFQKNMRIVEKILGTQIDAASLKVLSVQTIKEANDRAEIFIYPWQQEQFTKALAPRDESHEAILSPFYQADTSYSQMVRAGQKPSASLTLAQYEHVDINLHDYEKAAASYPALRAAIRFQRELIHKSARERILKSMGDLEKLPPADQALAAKDFRFRLFKDYFGISKLNFPTLREAQRAGADNYIPLLRNANVNSTKYGFIPVPVIKQALEKVPFFKNFMDWAIKLQKDVSKDGEGVLAERVKALRYIPAPLKKKLLAKVEASKGTIRSALATFVKDMMMEEGFKTPYSLAGDRKAYRLEARAAGNDGDQGGLSFSTSPDLYFSGSVFGNGSGKQVAVNVIRAPRGAVAINFVSSFDNEYEVVGTRPILRSAVVSHYNGEQMNERVELGVGALKDVMKDLIGVTSGSKSGEIELETPSAKCRAGGC